jgi:putative flippase GtrA
MQALWHNHNVMRKQTLQNLDWLFRHYVVFCLVISLGGCGLGTIVALLFFPELRSELIVWPLIGNCIGLVIGLIVARLLKARFHPRVIARLAAEGHNGNA